MMFNTIIVVVFLLYAQRNLDEVLDLEAFACEDDVIVQYAAVNKHGMSGWSRNTFINVYGGM